MTAFGAEAARAGAAVQAALANGVQRLTAMLSDWLAAMGHEAPASTAASLLAEAVGAVTLARMMGDRSKVGG